MTETNIENVNSNNDEKDQANLETEEIETLIQDEEDDSDDLVVLKERLLKANNANKQLYSRTKKATGFELKDGKWIKKDPTTIIEKKPEAKPLDKSNVDVDAKISEGINSALERRDLESLELSDELKKEVSSLAKLKGISVNAAKNEDYIKFKIEQENLKNNDITGNMPTGRKGSFNKIDTTATLDPRTEDGKKAIAKRDANLAAKLG